MNYACTAAGLIHWPTITWLIQAPLGGIGMGVIMMSARCLSENGRSANNEVEYTLALGNNQQTL